MYAKTGVNAAEANAARNAITNTIFCFQVNDGHTVFKISFSVVKFRF